MNRRRKHIQTAAAFIMAVIFAWGGVGFGIPSALADTNLLTNGGFENGTEGWGLSAPNGGMYEIVQDEVHGGQNALHMTAATNWPNNYALHRIPTVEGIKTVKVSFWLKASPSLVGQSLQIRVQNHNSGNGSNGKMNDSSGLTFKSANWEYYEWEFNLLELGYYDESFPEIRYGVQFMRNVSGEIWLDDVRAEVTEWQGEPPTPTPTPTPPSPTPTPPVPTPTPDGDVTNPVNLMTNGGFESSDAGTAVGSEWIISPDLAGLWEIVDDPALAHGGSKALKISRTDRTWKNSYAMHYANLVPGMDVVKVSFWMKSSPSMAGRQFQLRSQYYIAENDQPWEPDTNFTFSGSNQWEYYETVVRLDTSKAGLVRFGFVCGYTSGGGDVFWLDDVEVYALGNLADNGGFETGTTENWQMSGTVAARSQVVNDPAQAHSGNYAFRVNLGAAWDNTWFMHVVPMTSNMKIVKVSFWLKATGTVVGETLNMRAQYYIAENDQPWEPDVQHAIRAGGEWEYYEGIYILDPTRAKTVRFGLQGQFRASSGTLWMDDLFVEVLTEMPVTDIRFLDRYKGLTIGSPVTLEPILPEGASPRLVWTSSDTSVAVVDGNGAVTGLRAGQAVITAALFSDPRVKGSIPVFVGTSFSAVSDAITPTQGVMYTGAVNSGLSGAVYSVGFYPKDGYLKLNPDGAYKYKNDAPSNEVFSILAIDAAGNARLVTVTATVTSVNRAPSFQLWDYTSDLTSYNSLQGPRQTGGGFILGVESGASNTVRLNAYDPDKDSLTFSVATPPAHGTVTFEGIRPSQASLRYTSSGDGFTGYEEFHIRVSDGKGGTDTTIVGVLVLPDGNAMENMLLAKTAQNGAAHPRVLASAEDFNRAKAIVADGTDALANGWWSVIKSRADRILTESLQSNAIVGGRFLDFARNTENDLMTLGLTHWVTGDQRYADKAWAMIQNACNMPTWFLNGYELDTAEMVCAIAIGYDWFYDCWSDSQKAVMVNKIETTVSQIRNNLFGGRGLEDSLSNWNGVVNGGVGVGCMAILDAPTVADKALIKEVLVKTGMSLAIQAFSMWAPEEDGRGAYVEGPNYWNYGMKYLTFYMATADAALGSDLGYLDIPGMESAADMGLYTLNSAFDNVFNYGDTQAGLIEDGCFYQQWYGYKLNRPDYLWFNDSIFYSTNLPNGGSAQWPKTKSLVLLWYRPEGRAAAPPEQLDKKFSNIESNTVTFRSGWERQGGSFLGLRGGDNAGGHGDLDIGSFVYDALGVRWAEDFGMDSYDGTGYFDHTSGRWEYYKKRPEGHNTIIFNPDATPGQNILGYTKITDFQSGPAAGFAALDMTHTYAPYGAFSVLRGGGLFDNRSRAVIQDEIALKTPSEFYWFMHTTAQISVAADGRSATLTKSGQRLLVRLLDAPGSETARFTAMNAAPLPTSPVPGGSGNGSVGSMRKLAIHMENVTDFTVAVEMVPLTGSEEPAVGEYRPLSEWTVSGENTPVESVTVEGERHLIAKNGSKTLRAAVYPEDATRKGVTWSSSDPLVARVEPLTGKVTGVSKGEAVITAVSVADGAISGSTTVWVSETPNLLQNPGFENSPAASGTGGLSTPNWALSGANGNNMSLIEIVTNQKHSGEKSMHMSWGDRLWPNNYALNVIDFADYMKTVRVSFWFKAGGNTRGQSVNIRAQIQGGPTQTSVDKTVTVANDTDWHLYTAEFDLAELGLYGAAPLIRFGFQFMPSYAGECWLDDASVVAFVPDEAAGGDEIKAVSEAISVVQEEEYADVIKITDKPDGAVLTYSVQTWAANGWLRIDGESGEYTYSAKTAAPDSFVIKIEDQEGRAAFATITVSVTAVNHGPSFIDKALTGNYSVIDSHRRDEGVYIRGGTAGGAIAVQVTAYHPELSAYGPLTFSKTGEPAHGTAAEVSNGSWTYTADAGFTGLDHFTIKVEDREGKTDETDVYVLVFPAYDDIIGMLNAAHPVDKHPRVLATREDFDRMKSLVNAGDDTLFMEWWDKVQTSAASWLTAPLIEGEALRRSSDGRFIEGARNIQTRVMEMALAWYVTGDGAYAERIWRQLEICFAMSDWRTPGSVYLDTAEMISIVAVCYDWLYDYWTAERKQIMINNIEQKGFPVINSAGIQDGNWNAVYYGGAGTGALALLGESQANQDLVRTTLYNCSTRILESLIYLYPDGGYYEGPNYWNYLMKYLTFYLSTLEASLNTDFDFFEVSGMLNSGDFGAFMTSYQGLFNLSDTSSGWLEYGGTELQWLGNRLNDPKLLWLSDFMAEKMMGQWFNVLWYKPEGRESEPTADLDRLFGSFRNNTATFRSEWTNERAVFLGIHAGDNTSAHGDLDIGTFVFDAMGQRWAEDLGLEDYSNDDYWNIPSRWNYYKKRAEGHSTLVINPGSQPDQNQLGFGQTLSYKHNAKEAMAIMDLTAAYDKDTRYAYRGAALVNYRSQGLIQDEVSLNKPSEVYWFMHTSASVTIAPDGKSAVLERGGQRLWAQILDGSSPGARFTQMKAEPLPTTPRPQGNQNIGNYNKLTVHFTNVLEVNLAVALIPLMPGEDAPSSLPAYRPLSQWDVDNEPLVELKGIYLDGRLIDGFNPQKYNYNVIKDDFNLPQVTADAPDGSGYAVTVKPLARIPGFALVEVSKPDGSEKVTYKIYFNRNYKTGLPADRTEARIVDFVKEYERTADGGIAVSRAHDDTSNTNSTAWYPKYVTPQVPQAQNGPHQSFDTAIERHLRYSFQGTFQPNFIDYDLGDVYEIDNVAIAWWWGTRRYTIFDLAVSEDGENWTQVYSGQGSGKVDYYEPDYGDGAAVYEQYDFAPRNARYVRLTGYANSAGSEWVSIAQVKVFMSGKLEGDCEIAVSVSGGGSVTGAGAYGKGGLVELTAAPAAGCEFIGWYENGVKVSEPCVWFELYNPATGALTNTGRSGTVAGRVISAPYKFTASRNRTLEARFTSSALSDLIREVEEKFANHEFDGCEVLGVEALRGALADAKTVNDNKNATEQQINGAYDALLAALENTRPATLVCAAKSMLAKIAKLQAIPYTWNGAADALTFTTSNAAVCGVTRDGTLIPMKAGIAVITIAAPNGAKVIFAVTVSA